MKTSPRTVETSSTDMCCRFWLLRRDSLIRGSRHNLDYLFGRSTMRSAATAAQEVANPAEQATSANLVPSWVIPLNYFSFLSNDAHCVTSPCTFMGSQLPEP